jgi:integrase
MSDGPSETSLARYQYNLGRLKTLMGIEDESLKWLKNTKKVIDYIEGLEAYSLNYKKAFYIAIVSLLKLQNTLKKELEVYRAKQLEYNTEQKKIYADQVLSPTEEPKVMEWKDILKAAKTAEKGSIDELLVSLYTLQEPQRLDYANCKIVSEEPEDPKGNYLVMDATPHFLFTEYKTARRYGNKTKIIPKNLLTIIKKYLKANPTDILFPMHETNLSKLIGDTFQKLTGKRVTANILRHSFISHHKKNDKTIKQKEVLAAALDHSVGMSDIYRKVVT